MPLHLRNAPTGLMRKLGYGEGYRYPHDSEGAINEQHYMPDELGERRYYEPSERGYEGRLGFGGHTHLPMDRDLGDWRYVNIGSVGVPRDETRACYVIATFDGGKANIEFRRVPFDVEAVLTDFRQLNYPDMDYVTRFYRREW